MIRLVRHPSGRVVEVAQKGETGAELPSATGIVTTSGKP